MTLLEAKDKTAQANNFSDWQSMLYYPAYSDRRMVELRMNEVAELYARSKWDQCYDETVERTNAIGLKGIATKPPFQP